MPLYWIFLLLAIAVSLCAGVIDRKVNANGKLKKAVIAVCILLALGVTLLIKTAL